MTAPEAFVPTAVMRDAIKERENEIYRPSAFSGAAISIFGQTDLMMSGEDLPWNRFSRSCRLGRAMTRLDRLLLGGNSMFRSAR
jgi:hypothetical protein